MFTVRPVVGASCTSVSIFHALLFSSLVTVRFLIIHLPESVVTPGRMHAPYVGEIRGALCAECAYCRERANLRESYSSTGDRSRGGASSDANEVTA